MAKSTLHGSDSARPGRATYQDVLDAPAHRVAEIIGGTLHLSPRPAPLQALVSGTLRRTLAAAVFGRVRDGPDASRKGDPNPYSDWWIIREPELHLGEDIVVPDWVGWRRERMPELPEAGHVTLPPDWVCEIVSDSARRRDLHEKQPVYAREGVGHLWVVELTDRTLEAFELHEGEWVLIGSGKDDDPVSIRLFDAITFNLGDLWP